MDSSELITAIRRRALLRSNSEAQDVLEGVLQALGHVLPREYCDVVCHCEPEAMVWCLHCGPRRPELLSDSDEFLGWATSSIESRSGTDDEARTRVRIVLDELWARTDRPTAEVHMACLPCGVTQLSSVGNIR